PAGKTVFFSAFDRVQAWDMALEKSMWQLNIDPEMPWSFSHLALSGAGGELAVVGEDKSIWVLDALTGKSKSTLKRPDVDLSVNSVQFSADDKKIIVAHDSNIVVWDKSGGSATTIRPGNSRVDWAVPAPDGKLLAVSLAEHKAVYLWDIDKGLLVD